MDESGLSGTLVISIPLPSLPLEQWADRFMDAHPGVKIVIDCQEPDLLSMSPDWSKKYIERTVVSLTSGDAADIIDLDMTPIYRYANSGYFEDFYAYMENDPDIQMENYYTNIFEALETADGQLPVLPMGIGFTPLVFNTYMMDAMGGGRGGGLPRWRGLAGPGGPVPARIGGRGSRRGHILCERSEPGPAGYLRAVSFCGFAK